MSLIARGLLLLSLVACDKGTNDSSEPGLDNDGDGILAGEDCDDDDPSVGAPETRYADADGDGYGDPSAGEEVCPEVEDLVDNDYDCDDSDPAVPLMVDQATGSASGTGSASDPFDSIATALAQAPSCLVVGPGSYGGGHVVDDDLIMAGLEGAEATVLDAAGDGPVVEVLSGSVTLSGLTLTGGAGSSSLGSYTAGGAVQAWGAGRLVINDSTLSANQAQYGGALFGPEKGELSLSGTAFQDNVADTSGGAVYAFAVTMADCELSGNSAEYGGGMVLDVGEGTATGSVFSGNSAVHGGGLYLVGEAALSGGAYEGNTAEKGGGVFLGEDCTLSNASASGNEAERGGGFYIESGSSLADISAFDNLATLYGGGLHTTGDVSISGTALDDNQAESLGGGALLASGSQEISDLSCNGNSATSTGGGLYLHEAQASASGLLIEDNTAEFGSGAGLAASFLDARTGTATVSGNSATTYGGGLYLEGDSSWHGGSVTSNEALHGGGAFVSDTAVMEEVTIQGNSATGNGGGILANGTLAFTDGSLVGNASTDGAGVFVASGHAVLLSGGSVSGNAADSHGGGARVEGELQSAACSWGGENSPDDVYAGGESAWYDGVSSFTCTGSGGCS